jgi:hypothetical protein
MKRMLLGLVASAVILCAAQPALAGQGHGGHHGGYYGGYHGGPHYSVGFYGGGYGPAYRPYWPGYYAPQAYYPVPVAPVAPVYPVYPAYPYGAAFSYSSPGFSFSVAR